MSEETQRKLDALVRWIDSGSSNAPSAEASATNGHRTEGAAPVLTDQDVLQKLIAEDEKGHQWESVYNGAYEAYYPSKSEAVAALLFKLAFYAGKDWAQMERLIRGSALAGSKFDERRNGTTWLGREIQKAIDATDEVYTPSKGRSRSFSSFHSPLGGASDDENNAAPEIKWFAELGEPKPRKYLIESVGVKSYPIVAYGAGGVAKSFAVLAAGIAIASASGCDEWLGLQVLEHGHVLYLDFELDVEEQHRRVRGLCNGLGVPVPKRLAYLSGVGIPTDAAFEHAYAFVKEYKAAAVIIDSVGIAMVGDMDRAKDVNAFYNRYVGPFRRMGVTPFLVDHEGKLQAGEKHKDKSPIGSVYKTNNSRSVLQFILDEYDEENSALDIRVRQHKTNFAPIKPFGVRITFAEHRVSIEARALPAEELIDEDRLPVRGRILAALRVEPQTVPDLEKLTGAATGTIYNNLSQLIDAGEVAEDGYRGRKKLYRLFSSSPPPPRGDENDENNDEGLFDAVPEDVQSLLTEEGERRVQRQVREGTAEVIARINVYGQCAHKRPKCWPCDECGEEISG